MNELCQPVWSHNNNDIMVLSVFQCLHELQLSNKPFSSITNVIVHEQMHKNANWSIITLELRLIQCPFLECGLWKGKSMSSLRGKLTAASISYSASNFGKIGPMSPANVWLYKWLISSVTIDHSHLYCCTKKNTLATKVLKIRGFKVAEAIPVPICSW